MLNPQTWRLAVATALLVLCALAAAGTAAAAPQVVLSPASSTYVVGDSATLTATASDNATGAALADQTIVFTITSGPNTGMTDQTVTDQNGEATFTYSSSSTGTDVVSAFIPTSETGSNDATVTWNAGPPPTSVQLAPASSTHVVGDSATLTATASDTSSGRPLPDQNITFTILRGPNSDTSKTTVTDQNGQATFTYSSSKTGTDTVQAFLTQSEAASNEATVSLDNPPPPPPPPPPVPPKTDVQLTLDAPSLAHVGENATWTASLTNAGPDTATGVVFRATATGGATLVSATESRGNGCSGSTCAVGTLAPGATASVTLVYTPSQAGSLVVSASVEADFDTNTSNNSASTTTPVVEPGATPPPPPPPSQPGTFNAIPTGTVLVNGTDQPADQLFVLHSGDTIDVTGGVLTFTAADGSTANFSSSQPPARRHLAAAKDDNVSAQFTVEQPASGGAPTLTLTGGDFSSCSSARGLAASKKPIRQLWGSAKGSFRTSAKYSSATVRGTIWLVQDRCDGTLTQVVEGVVDVFDAVRKKTVTVNAGGTYLATPLPALKLTAQTPAQIAKRGLVYGGHVYKTKLAFTKRLKAIGYTWAQFAKKYPRPAAALAKRR